MDMDSVWIAKGTSSTTGILMRLHSGVDVYCLGLGYSKPKMRVDLVGINYTFTILNFMTLESTVNP